MTWDVVGQARAVELLRQSLRRGTGAHAYLFSGPTGVGKRTLALEYARALNCERLGPGTANAAPDPRPFRSSLPGDSGGGQPDEPPCGQCRRCRLIGEGKHPEVRVVGLEPGHRVIRVGDVEAIQADAALRPADVYRKVYIVEHADLLHPDAANRLLKTIEEPPDSVVMILTTVDSDATMPTIVSRCQQVRVRPLARAALTTYLTEAHGLDPARAELLAALGEGRVGWAIDAANDARLLERRAGLLDDLGDLVEADRIERLQYARKLADRWSAHPETVRETLEIWLRYLRDVLMVQGAIGHRVVNIDRRADVDRLAQQLPPEAVATATAGTRDVIMMLDQNVNARLALDVVVLGLPRSATMPIWRSA